MAAENYAPMPPQPLTEEQLHNVASYYQKQPIEQIRALVELALFSPQPPLTLLDLVHILGRLKLTRENADKLASAFNKTQAMNFIQYAIYEQAQNPEGVKIFGRNDAGATNIFIIFALLRRADITIISETAHRNLVIAGNDAHIEQWCIRQRGERDSAIQKRLREEEFAPRATNYLAELARNIGGLSPFSQLICRRLFDAFQADEKVADKTNIAPQVGNFIFNRFILPTILDIAPAVKGEDIGRGISLPATNLRYYLTHFTHVILELTRQQKDDPASAWRSICDFLCLTNAIAIPALYAQLGAECLRWNCALGNPQQLVPADQFDAIAQSYATAKITPAQPPARVASPPALVSLPRIADASHASFWSWNSFNPSAIRVEAGALVGALFGFVAFLIFDLTKGQGLDTRWFALFSALSTSGGFLLGFALGYVAASYVSHQDPSLDNMTLRIQLESLLCCSDRSGFEPISDARGPGQP